jgi:prophage regulatory protein
MDGPRIDCVVTGPEVQRLLGDVSRGTLARWIKLGHFPPPLIIGPGRRGWRYSDVIAWIDARESAGTCESPPRIQM